MRTLSTHFSEIPEKMIENSSHSFSEPDIDVMTSEKFSLPPIKVEEVQNEMSRLSTRKASGFD